MKISIKLFDSCVEKKVSIKLFESFVSSYLFCNETDIGTVVVVWSSGMEQWYGAAADTDSSLVTTHV